MNDRITLMSYQKSEIEKLVSESVYQALERMVFEKASSTAAQKTILTRQEAAIILNISLPTLHLYTKQGIIKGFRLGTKVRYRYEDIIDSLTLINVGGARC
jgi:excisionase family DNA binding protein